MKKWALRAKGAVMYECDDIYEALDWVGEHADLSKKCNLIGGQPAYLVGWWWLPDGDVVGLILNDLYKEA